MGLKEELVSMLERQRLVQYSVVLVFFFLSELLREKMHPAAKNL